MLMTMMMLNEDFVNLPAFHLLVHPLVHLLVLKLHYYKFHQQNLLLYIVLFVRLPRCFHKTVMLVLLHQTYQGTIHVEELVHQFEP